jgi:hypothetical protein
MNQYKQTWADIERARRHDQRRTAAMWIITVVVCCACIGISAAIVAVRGAV